MSKAKYYAKSSEDEQMTAADCFLQVFSIPFCLRLNKRQTKRTGFQLKSLRPLNSLYAILLTNIGEMYIDLNTNRINYTVINSKITVREILLQRKGNCVIVKVIALVHILRLTLLYVFIIIIFFLHLCFCCSLDVISCRFRIDLMLQF